MFPGFCRFYRVVGVCRGFFALIVFLGFVEVRRGPPRFLVMIFHTLNDTYTLWVGMCVGFVGVFRSLGIGIVRRVAKIPAKLSHLT